MADSFTSKLQEIRKYEAAMAEKGKLTPRLKSAIDKYAETIESRADDATREAAYAEVAKARDYLPRRTAALDSAMQGAFFGFGDEIMGALDPTRTIDDYRRRVEKGRAQYPKMTTLTELGSGAVTGLALPGLGLARGAAAGAQLAARAGGVSRALGAAAKYAPRSTLGKGAAIGAAEGAAAGVGYGNADSLSAAVGDAAGGAAAGGALGTAIPLGLRGARNAADRFMHGGKRVRAQLRKAHRSVQAAGGWEKFARDTDDLRWADVTPEARQTLRITSAAEGRSRLRPVTRERAGKTLDRLGTLQNRLEVEYGADVAESVRDRAIEVADRYQWAAGALDQYVDLEAARPVFNSSVVQRTRKAHMQAARAIKARHIRERGQKDFTRRDRSRAGLNLALQRARRDPEQAAQLYQLTPAQLQQWRRRAAALAEDFTDEEVAMYLHPLDYALNLMRLVDEAAVKAADTSSVLAQELNDTHRTIKRHIDQAITTTPKGDLLPESMAATNRQYLSEARGAHQARKETGEALALGQRAVGTSQPVGVFDELWDMETFTKDPRTSGAYASGVFRGLENEMLKGGPSASTVQALTSGLDNQRFMTQALRRSGDDAIVSGDEAAKRFRLFSQHLDDELKMRDLRTMLEESETIHEVVRGIDPIAWGISHYTLTENSRRIADKMLQPRVQAKQQALSDALMQPINDIIAETPIVTQGNLKRAMGPTLMDYAKGRGWNRDVTVKELVGHDVAKGATPLDFFGWHAAVPPVAQYHREAEQ